MGTGMSPPVGQIDPTEAWRLLERERSARLIDVRTRAEWAFVGVPDLRGIERQPLYIEWARYPDMSLNPEFTADASRCFGSGKSLCRRRSTSDMCECG